MKLYYLFLSFFITATALSQGSSKGATSLKLPITPFIAATCESFVADPVAIRSLLINPANITSYDTYEIMFAHTEWIQDIRTELLSVIAPFRYGSLALSIANSSVDGLELRTIPGPAIGTFNAQATRFQLTYGVKLSESIQIGIAPKYIYEKIFVDETTGFGIDAGALYLPHIDGLIIGFSVTNLGSLSAFRNEKIDLPSQIRIGGTYSFMQKKLTFRTAGSFSSELGTSVNHVNLGTEIIYDNIISARFGYKTNYEIGSFSAGLGIRYSLMTIDYAYLPSSMQVGDAHIFSIIFTF
jgi:hypothetical protein